MSWKNIRIASVEFDEQKKIVYRKFNNLRQYE